MMNDFHYDGSTIFLNIKNEIIVQRCTVRENSSFHTHSFIEIAYIASGHGVHEIECGYSSEVGQGDLILFNSNVAHAFKVSENGDLTVYNCIFDPSVLRFAITKSDDFINIVCNCLFDGKEQSSVSKPYITLSGAERIFPIINEMFTEYSEKRSGYEKYNEANLIRLLVAVFRLRMNEVKSGGAYGGAVAESAIRYMNEYYAENITCEALAARAYMSTGYFHHVFRSAAGQSPVRYLQSVRLAKAAELLCDPNVTVKEAAASVGYSDMKHFYKIFTEKYGVTPGRYAKKTKI